MSAILKALDLGDALKWAKKKANGDAEYFKVISSKIWEVYLEELVQWVYISPDLVRQVRMLTKVRNMGFKDGQVPPGEGGRIKVWTYFNSGSLPANPEHMIVCGLTARDIANNEKEWHPRFMRELQQKITSKRSVA